MCHRFVFLSLLLLFSLTAACSPESSRSAAPPEAMNAYVDSMTRIISGHQVRVRTQPDAHAKEVAKLPLGTLVIVLQRSEQPSTIAGMTDYWYQLESPAGWLFGSFTQGVNPNDPTAASLALVQAKLGAVGSVAFDESLKFTDVQALQQFAAQAATQTNDADSRGELELAAWRATDLAFQTIPYDKQGQEPYQSWIESLGQNKVYFHELAGRMAVSPETYWALADRYQNNRVGDRIAWQAAHSVPGGECEGDIACLSTRSQQFEGEYLRRYPQGQYVTEALANVTEVFEYLQAQWNDQAHAIPYLGLTQWETLLASVAESPARNKAQQLLQALQQQQKASPQLRLDTIFRDLASCTIDFYYTDWGGAHAYFTVNKLQPFRDGGESYYFNVEETLFGLPVVGLIVPGTWAIHGVVFDRSPTELKAALQQVWGQELGDAKQEGWADLRKPVVDTNEAFPDKAVVFCDNEPSV